ncbi:zinc-binding dehydrogenase, partial [Gibbsiella quercinecans]
ILQQVADMVDNGKLGTTLSETLHGLTVENLLAAHKKVLEGHMQGKLVIAY